VPDVVEAAVGEPRAAGVQPLRATLPSCAVAAGTLALESTVLWLLQGRVITLVWAATAHLAVTIALGLWAWQTARAQVDLRFSMLLATTTAVLGPIGAAGTLVATGLGVLYSRSAIPFEQWYESLFPEKQSPLSAHLFEQVSSEQANGVERTSVVPFLDILSYGTIQQRQAVVNLIADHFQPAFAPSLRQALNDPSNVIRVQAAAVTTRVEDNFLSRAMELGAALQEKPDDPDRLRALARHYDDYAFAGILDSKREQDNRDKALELYRDYLRYRPEDLDARYAVGRILLRSGEIQQAAQSLGQSIQKGYSSPQILLWYMEALFRLGRFQQLREVARAHYADFSASDRFPNQVVETIALWAGGPGDPQEAS